MDPVTRNRREKELRPLFWGLRLVAVVGFGATAALAQSNANGPHIGYAYPAGGQRGTTFEVIVGGQFLRGASDAYVSGMGVHVKVVQYYLPLIRVVQQHREEIRRLLAEMIRKRVAELPGGGRNLPPELQGFIQAGLGGNRPKAGKQASSETEEMPEHPLLRNLDKKSLRELLHIRNELLTLRKAQPSRSISESVLISVTIDRNAAVGDRELRLATPQGLTNPLCFQVGSLPEATEQEPNDPRPMAALLPGDQVLELPVLVNGQINAGDVDRFRFHARRGQQLAIVAQARHLIPYLADAVPGWFQAAVTLYDPRGREAAFADDYRFDPDPVLFYKTAEEGEYQLEIRDTLYRGRDDFVYRVAIGERGLIARSFPSINQTATGGTASGPATMPAAAPADNIRGLADRQLVPGDGPLPELNETEPNDSPEKAQLIELPRLIDGRISKPGDVDVFQFNGRAGAEVVAEVYARRLNSPLDSLLRLTDASGKVLEWNDDHEDKECGLVTHHADSYIRAKLPADGVYYVCMSDSEHHGGPAYTYRLRISPPRPDFALRLTPSSLNVRTGGAASFSVYAVRKDGFEGDIDIVLKKPPQGFALKGARIAAGRDQVEATLSAPRRPLEGPTALQFEGVAGIGGRTVRRPAVPAEDMMQAFAYRQLVPSQELLVTTLGNRRPAPPVERIGTGPVRIVAGGTAKVRFRVPRRPMIEKARFELRDPPEGLALTGTTLTPDGLALELTADGEKVKPGLTGNLIIEAFVQPPGSRPAANKGRQNRQMSLGMLPAIPFEIARP